MRVCSSWLLTLCLLAAGSTSGQSLPQKLEPYLLPSKAQQTVESLARSSDVLILGEIHGTQEVPRLAAQLLDPLSKLGYGVLALEVPADQQESLTEWATGKTNKVPLFFNKQLDLEDGRGNVQMLALIRTALAAPHGWKLICFDQRSPDFGYFANVIGKLWELPAPTEPTDYVAEAVNRDREMAKTLARERERLAPQAKVLAICGNIHARVSTSRPPANSHNPQEDEVLSKLWPSFAAALAADHPAWQVHAINIVPHGGDFFASMSTEADMTPRVGVHPVRSNRRLTEADAVLLKNNQWNLELNLPRTTAATFLRFTNPTIAPSATGSSTTAVPRPRVRNELLRRMQLDQNARLAWVEWSKSNSYGESELTPDQKAAAEKFQAKIKATDDENIAWLKEIVAKYGWPSKRLVGPDGASAAWLLVQHADDDSEFQRKCLDLMIQLPKDEVSQTDLAYLTDRVLLAEGKKQIYGTQFTSQEGKWQPRPLEDEGNVDARRAKVGLPPLADYLKSLREMYEDRKSK